jgi:hypothetical protein
MTVPSFNVISAIATRSGRARVRRSGELHLRSLLYSADRHPLPVRGFKRRGAVHQHDGDHVLKRDVGHVPIVHDLRFGMRHTDDHFLHIVGLHRALLEDVVHRVERRLDRGADRPLFDVGPGDFESLTEPLDEQLWFGRPPNAAGSCRRQRNVVEPVETGGMRSAAVKAAAGGMPANTNAFSMCSVAVPGADA